MAISSFADLSEKIYLLEEYYQSLPVSKTLRERTLTAYHARVLSNLKQASNELSEEKLKQFLAQNWKIIQRTGLSYTAIPDDEVTLLLCEVAEWLRSPEQGALNLLMPTVHTECLNDDYPHLGSYRNEKGYLQVASVSLADVLKTHVLGQGGAYLIPIKYLTALKRNVERIPNLYYDYQRHQASMVYLSSDEQEKLFQHSSLTLALKQELLTYEDYLNKDESFLKHVSRLRRNLFINSVNGIGQEANAGSFAYAAIIEFNEYYQHVSEEQRKNIPQALQDELALLLELAADPTKNVNKWGEVSGETCLAIRSASLKSLIEKHELLLSTLVCDENTQVQLLQTTKDNIQKGQEIIQRQLQQGAYVGQEKLGLTPELLRLLNLQCSISDGRDLHDFMMLDTDEISRFLDAEPGLWWSILDQFPTINELCIFCIENKPEKIEVLFSKIAILLQMRFFGVKNLIALLRPLDDQRSSAVLRALSPKLSKVTTTIDEFIHLSGNISSEQRILLWDAVGNNLLKGVSTWSELRLLLLHVPPECHKSLSGNLKNKLYQLKDNLIALLGFLPEELFQLVLSELDEILPQVILSATQFNHLLYWLKSERRSPVYQMMKCSLVRMMDSARDFKIIMQYLRSEERTEVYQLAKNELPNLINSASYFNLIFQYLSIEERSELYSLIKNILPSLIKSAHDFKRILRYLSPQERIEFYTLMQEHLIGDGFINDPKEFNLVLQYLPEAQRTQLYLALLPKLITYPLTAENLVLILQYLDLEQCTYICQQLNIGETLSLENEDDFYCLLRRLPNEHFRVVCTMSPRCITEAITSVAHLSIFEEFDDLDKIQVVYNILDEQLEHLITTEEDLQLLLYYTPLSLYGLIFARLKNRLPEILDSIERCQTTYDLLSKGKKVLFYEAIRDIILSKIGSSADFQRVMLFLGKRGPQFYEYSKEALFPQLITDATSFLRVLEFLSQVQRTEVYELLQPRLFDYVQSMADLASVLWFITPEQGVSFCNGLTKERLMRIVLAERSISTLLILLSSAQLVEVLPIIAPLLPYAIKNVRLELGLCLQFCNGPEIEKSLFQAYFQGLQEQLDDYKEHNFYGQLVQATNNYFANLSTIEEFQQASHAAIQQARIDIKGESNLLLILGKWLASVFSFGTILLASTIKSRYETGKWKCRFFEYPMERTLEHWEDTEALMINSRLRQA